MPSRNYYRFLNETYYNWKKFLFLLAARVISVFDNLTHREGEKVLILGDSVIKRNRSKNVELLARMYDHVEHRFQKSFSLLTLAWSDGYKSRMESMMKKTDAAVLLIKRALDFGIKADYVLMDTWFTTEPMLKEILKTGIHAIGMVKQLNQTYLYQGKSYTLPQLRKFMKHENAVNIFGSLLVTTKKGIPVKIVFIRNRNKKSECIQPSYLPDILFWKGYAGTRMT